MIMAILLSLTIGLFASLVSSLIGYADALRQELEAMSEKAAEERMLVEATSNGSHVLLHITSRSPREVELSYILLKCGGELRMERANLMILPYSTAQVAFAIPQNSSSSNLEVILVAKRGTTYKVNPLSNSIKDVTASNETIFEVPYDMCLINDVDVVDEGRGLVVASHENGGILMIDVKDSSVLWSKEFLASKTENVAYSEALNATIASISRTTGSRVLSVVALRDGKLLSIQNFYDYIYRSSSVEEHVHQPAIIGRHQDYIIVPEICFSGSYYSLSNYWLFEAGLKIKIVKPTSPMMGELLLQSIEVLDLRTSVRPWQYQSNPEVFPKFRVIGCSWINQSFAVLLVRGVFYSGVDGVYTKYRCTTVANNGVLVPPTLHALDNGSLSWYLPLYPCDVSSPNFLTKVGNFLAVASGPYLYFVDLNGHIVKRLDFNTNKITALKSSRAGDKLIVGLSSGEILIYNEALGLEKSISSKAPNKILDVVLLDNNRVIAFNETHAFDLEDPSRAAKLPSTPYKVLALNARQILIASPSGLLVLAI